jgi:hypothetical protein
MHNITFNKSMFCLPVFVFVTYSKVRELSKIIYICNMEQHVLDSYAENEHLKLATDA